jgi:hypothetical protein
LTAVATSGCLAVTENMWKKNEISSLQSKAHQPLECIEFQHERDATNLITSPTGQSSQESVQDQS